MSALLMTLIIPFGLINPAHSETVKPVDEIIAVVDDDIIVRSELESEIIKIVTQLRQQEQRLPPRSVLEKQVLGRLILKKLQLAAAARAGINVSEDIVAQAINNIAQNNNLSLSEFRQTLEQGGISFRTFRKGIQEEIIMQRLQDQEVRRRIRITDQEVDAFIARQASSVGERSAYELQHILIATPEAASPEQMKRARERAESIVTSLRNGAEFADIAITESDGRQALEGGDLGWRKANQLPTLFVDLVINMERGEISDPIRTASGYHIIRLNDYKGGDRKIITQSQVRHILISTNEVTSNSDAKTRLEQLRQRIIGGDDFAALARSHSDDKSSAIKGGDLGWITPGALLPRFEEEIEKLSPGELTEPFRTEFGWHLAQLIERRQHDSTAEIQKAEARKAISNRKTAEEGELYLRRLKDEAYIDIRLGDS
ncbi:peptidylprolyl isomerase [Sedimenticola selenatireducens]|uniref:Chaperone SurA n=1 Tax=Sedimenticola selenatireducens TaxID=191960 RepID=A0A558DU77_9GAMM|nr:peptidylprolyl isomerase [Sedimenticola selenatireducens]TVO76606.1 molecular chaperone SurA [Sedimenticola selenatireducens]TVT64539.1 MAG: molecular chaperone SurA [Sedimenticola selenatireducens]